MGGGASRTQCETAFCRAHEAVEVVTELPQEPPDEPLPLREDKQRTLDDAEAEAKAVAQEFSDAERAHLISRFESHAASGTASVEALSLVPELAGLPFALRVLQVFDDDNDEQLTVDEFIAALVALRRSNPNDEARFQLAFKVNDADGDGRVSRDDLLQTLLTACPGLPKAKLHSAASQVVAQHARENPAGLSLAEFTSLLSRGDLHDVFGFIP